MLGHIVLLSALLFSDASFPPQTTPGANAVITGTLSAAPGDLIVLDASNSVGDAKKWVIPEGLESKHLTFGDRLVFSTGTAGRYRVGLAVAAKGDPLTIDVRFVDVQIGDGKPFPNPNPGPNPGPTPNPKPEPIPPAPTPSMKGSFIVLVEESGDGHKFPHVSSLKQSKSYWDALERDKGVKFFPYDQNNPALGGYKQDALTIGLPAMLVVSPDGRVIGGRSCPVTTSGVDELLREVFK